MVGAVLFDGLAAEERSEEAGEAAAVAKEFGASMSRCRRAVRARSRTKQEGNRTERGKWEGKGAERCIH